VTPFDVWRCGVSLAEAVEGTDAGRRWTETRTRVLGAFHRLQTDPRSPLFDRVESTLRVQALAADWQEQMHLLEDAREVVRRRLSSGELFGCGFVGCGGQPQQLAAVPPETWREATNIDWDTGGVTGKGSTFADVRVVPRPQEWLTDDGEPDAVGCRPAD
jgi:hypothetical protein